MATVLAACTGSSPEAQRRLPIEDLEVALVSAVRPFDSCDSLARRASAEAAKLVGPYGLGGGRFATTMLAAEAVRASGDDGTDVAGAAAEPGGTGTAAFSKTNNQEAGVDEPDRVKTDGRTMVTLRGDNTLRILDVGGDRPEVVGTLPFPDGHQATSLFLEGDRVLVFGSGLRPDRAPASAGDERGRSSPSPLPYGADAFVASVDISSPSAPQVVSTLWHDGEFVTARLVDGVARVVFHVGGPRGIDFVMPQVVDRSDVLAEGTSTSELDVDLDEATEENRRRLAEAGGEDWLPEVAVEEPGRPLSVDTVAGCDDVFAPDDVSGTGMVAVLTVDASSGAAGEEAVVLGAGEQVYASRASLYVLTADWEAVELSERGAPAEVSTSIHRFDFDEPGRAEYVASGAVPGMVLNQFSLSEHEGVLRVATTLTGRADPGRSSESLVTTLRRVDDALQPIGQVSGLGKGERIYAVRFIGETGYVVTFRQTDPLYVLDLRDPATPRVTGELKIPGYSAYLHPLGEGWLIGLGQDADENGRTRGLQLSVFDVRDPASPQRVHQRTVSQGGSSAEHDHHAFLHWPATGLTVVPVSDGAFLGAVGFRVDPSSGIDEVGRIRHPSPRRSGRSEYDGSGWVDRSVVVDDRLLTISDAGVLASDLTTLDELGWTPFS